MYPLMLILSLIILCCVIQKSVYQFKDYFKETVSLEDIEKAEDLNLEETEKNEQMIDDP